MPGRNTIKISVAGSYYHIYNRGVEKRTIFEDEQDYKVFLKYLKEALAFPPHRKSLIKTFTLQGTSFKGVPRLPKNFYEKIELVAFCLMPNHFHLLIKQVENGAMQSLMRSLLTRYSAYFNTKYDRIGPLFQGRYKAVAVQDDSYLLHLSRYIHLNPKEYSKKLTSAYSSYATYLGKQRLEWVKPKTVLDFFEKGDDKLFQNFTTYKQFVEKYDKDPRVAVGKLSLD